VRRSLFDRSKGAHDIGRLSSFDLHRKDCHAQDSGCGLNGRQLEQGLGAVRIKKDRDKRCGRDNLLE
jgi:hypothetical protein